MLIHIDSAFHRFFKKIVKYPAFKKKGHSGSSSVPQYFNIDGNHLTIPQFNTTIRFFRHREIIGTMRSLTITKTHYGKHYLSVLADTGTPLPASQEIKPDTAVGMDVGITEFLTLSDGIQIKILRILKNRK